MDRCVYIPKRVVDEALAEPPRQGKHHLATFTKFAEKHGLPEGAGRILEDCEVDNRVYEVHLDEADLWIGLQGEATFIVGGELVNPQPKKRKDGSLDSREPRSEEVRGETQVHTVEAGDWLYIPPGVPHRHRTEGIARLVIIKIPVPQPK